MKERPIIFSGEMVQAILDGRKTQTRRVVTRIGSAKEFIETVDGINKLVDVQSLLSMKPNQYPQEARGRCPYGRPGDRLWVRETWGLHPDLDGQLKDDGLTPGSIDNEGFHIGYKADGSGAYCIEKWRPSIFMPRWASRILLEITDVRVECVQDISYQDMVAEGLYPTGKLDCLVAFESLWDSINAKRGYPWSSNPWVWVIKFKMTES